MTFNRLKQLIPESAEDKDAFVRDSLKESKTVVFSEDGKNLRRATTLPDEDKSVQQTVFAKTFALDAELEEVQKVFATFGEVLMVRMRRDAEKKFNGTVFVEFANAEFAEAATKAEEVTFKDAKLEQVVMMQEFLKSLKAAKSPKATDGKKRKREGEDESSEKEQKTEEPEEVQYEKGLIIKIIKITEGAGREELKEALGVHGDVQYVDFSRGDTEGFVRMNSAEDATKSLAAEYDNDWELSAVEGEDEKAYWVQVREFQKNKKNSGKRGKGKGKGKGKGRGKGKGKGKGKGGKGKGKGRSEGADKKDGTIDASAPPQNKKTKFEEE